MISVDPLLQSLAVAGFALMGALAGMFLGYESGRRASKDALQGVQIDFDKLKTATANLASQTRDNMERAYQHAQRAAGHDSNQKKRGEAKTPQWTVDSYMAHLNKGGAADPQIEAQLGIGA